MIFRPELAQAVLEGRKTVTRRLCSDNPRSPWWREACAFVPGGGPGGSYAVQPGRSKAAIGRIRIVSVEREFLARMLGGVAGAWGEARREGVRSPQAFAAAWEAINGEFDPFADVWRVEFEAVR